MIISLPYPPTTLSPNARKHWAVKSRATRGYRYDCAMSAKSQGLGKLEGDMLYLRVIFCPPNKRRRDYDNAIAAFKAGQDALADVTGIDDSNFRVTYAPHFGEPTKGGAVLVDIEEG